MSPVFEVYEPIHPTHSTILITTIGSPSTTMKWHIPTIHWGILISSIVSVLSLLARTISLYVYYVLVYFFVSFCLF
ncbi:hypothetical protein BDN70DRAFT_354352 [Pholiota conissans]|uniref:Uncharacterized protein n=1 Tax=Pholiota conissans TaxID=109636 RepID=A0A9P5YRG9_9AGAR|nr:hypothetical protein BDN70DRAFT_354352 [Pholiota conissans]